MWEYTDMLNGIKHKCNEFKVSGTAVSWRSQDKTGLQRRDPSKMVEKSDPDWAPQN